jgi:hypothetical protein
MMQDRALHAILDGALSGRAPTRDERHLPLRIEAA